MTVLSLQEACQHADALADPLHELLGELVTRAAVPAAGPSPGMDSPAGRENLPGDRHERWVAGWATPHLGQRLAVIGAGSGVRAHAWLDRGAVLVTGADEDAVQLAQRFRLAAHVQVAGGGAGREWGPAVAAAVAAFAPDTVLIDGALARAEDPAALLRGLAAVIPASARLVVLEPAGDGRPGRVGAALGARRTFPPGALESLLKAGGFTVRDIRGHDPLGNWLAPLAERAVGRRGLEALARMIWEQLLPLARGLDLWTAGPGRIRLAIATRDR